MKLKRFLALAVSLAMVLSIVPAFSLTASAAIGDTIVIDGVAYVIDSENLVANGTFEDGISGWQTYNSSALAPVNGTDIAHATDKANSGTGSLKVVANGGGTSAGSLVGLFDLGEDVKAGDKFVLTLYFNGGDALTLTAGLTNSLTTVTVDESCGGLGNSGTSPVSCNLTGLKAGQWNKLSYVLTANDSSAAALVYPRWCGGAYFDDVSLYKVVDAASTTATVVYTDGAETLWTETASDLSVGGSYTPAMPGSGVVVNNNVVYDVVAVEGIDTLSATASENVATVTLAKKFGIVKNFIENGDFETGDLTGWGANEAADAWFDVIDGNNGTGNKVLKSTANAWVSHEVCAIGGERSFQKVVTGIEPGKVYYYTADVYTGSNVGLWMNYAFLTNETRMTYGNTGNLYVTEGAQTNCTTDACATGTQLSNNYKQQWHTFSGLVTADEAAKAFEFDVYYLHDSPNSLIDNVAFYETDIVTSATTIKYVDAQGTELKAAETVEGFVGDVIDLTDETIVPETITYNGNLYSKTDSNATSHTVATAADVVEVVYVTDAIVSIDTTPIATTVIGTNTPVLPATIKATTGTGAEADADVEWNLDSLTEGENTVYGTVAGTELKAVATVNVLPVSFELDDAESFGAQPGNVVYFPVAINGEFTIEFDYLVNTVADASVQMGYNGTIFGAAALGISPNTSVLKVTGGNKAGTGEGIELVKPVAAGDTFRMLLTMDASDDTYTLTVTKPDGTAVTTGEKGFRTAQNAINTMTVILNGNNINNKGTIVASNIKVYAAEVEAMKTEYTVVTTVNGVTESTETVKVISVDEITAEEREGYMLTKTVDGNTVTFTYVSTIDVTITYTVNGETIKTETKKYDPLVSAGAEFDAVTYAANGLNAIYEAAAATYSASQSVELTARANNGAYEVGAIFVSGDGTQYEIASANLIPNADFADGTLGWFGGDGNQLGASVSGNAVTLGGAGGGDNKSLKQSWAIESGKTYLYTYNTTGGGNTWHITSLQNALNSDENTTKAPVLVGTTDKSTLVGTLAAADSTGTNNFVFTNTDGYAYLQSAFRWTGATFSNFGLYELVPATVTVTEEIDSVEAVAEIKAFGNDTVVLPATLKVTGTLGSNVDGTVAWDAPTTFPAGTTPITGTVTAQFGTAEPVTTTVSTNVTVIDEFTLDSFTSAGNQNDGKSNQVVFPVAIRGAFTMKFTANYASFGDLFITMKTADAGFFGPEQIALGVNGDKGFRPVNGNGAGGRTTADDNQAFLTEGVDYGFIVTTDASADKYSVVIYDIATGVVVAEVNDFGYRTNADAIEVITALTNNGQGSVTLTNIKVDTSVVEFYTVTVDGVAKKVVKGASYGQALEGAALVDTNGNIYAPVNGFVTVPVDSDMVLTTKALGLTMVGGAQVRIGATELEEGAKLDAMADSGLRFLATADYNDTLLADATEFGIKVTAEGSDKVVYVPATTFQNADETVFSAAITNLAESNYNRKYTAVAYAKVNGVEITTGEVTRSIYQVSAGIMKNGSADAEGAEYTVDGVVKNILNAYVNQTGIRLSYTADGIAVEDGKYTGDVFFTVESVSDGDDGWNVTITPAADWGTKAEIAAWWTDYVRFNNNNKVAKTYISNAEFVDGTLTFNFDKTVD